MHERETYCRTEGNSRCPTYRLYQLRRGPIPQELYYSVWMPPAAAAVAEERELHRAAG